MSKQTKPLHGHVNHIQYVMRNIKSHYISYLDGENLKKREIIAFCYPGYRKAAKSQVIMVIGQTMNNQARSLAFFKHFHRYIPQFNIRT